MCAMVVFSGDKDPGYGSTSKMMSEGAVFLARHPSSAAGGIWTPASAMGEPFLAELQSKAGLSFYHKK